MQLKPEDVFEEIPPKKDYFSKIQELNEELLQNIKKNLPELEKLLEEVNGHWVAEDLLYRAFHYSYKVYYIQDYTIKIAGALKKIAPKSTVFHELFEMIYKEGTGKIFKMEHNKAWPKHTRPMIESFLLSKAILENICKYGKELKKAPECLPSGWALILEIFGMR